MSTTIIQDAVMGSVAVSWIVLVLGFLFRRRGSSPAESKRDGTAAVGFLLQVSGYALVGFIRRQYRTPLFDLGVVAETGIALCTILLATTSVWFALSAIMILGKQWSPAARIVDQHELITRGPYNIVRHPIYTGLFGLMIATGLALSSVWAVLIAAVIYLLGSLVRIRSEEKLLLEHFGDQYAAYQRRVPAFIPSLGLGSRSGT